MIPPTCFSRPTTYFLYHSIVSLITIADSGSSVQSEDAVDRLEDVELYCRRPPYYMPIAQRDSRPLMQKLIFIAENADRQPTASRLVAYVIAYAYKVRHTSNKIALCESLNSFNCGTIYCPVVTREGSPLLFKKREIGRQAFHIYHHS